MTPSRNTPNSAHVRAGMALRWQKQRGRLLRQDRAPIKPRAMPTAPLGCRRSSRLLPGRCSLGDLACPCTTSTSSCPHLLPHSAWLRACLVNPTPYQCAWNGPVPLTAGRSQGRQNRWCHPGRQACCHDGSSITAQAVLAQGHVQGYREAGTCSPLPPPPPDPRDNSGLLVCASCS